MLNKPYYRIARPKARIPEYVIDPQYSTDRLQLSRAYTNIERDLRRIFDFIEPGDDNASVYSFELYSLLLRACTEVELNCKLILSDNGYEKKDRNGRELDLNMGDYMKIEQSSKLSKYKVTYRNWRDQSGNHVSKVIIPFENFGLATPCSPNWYKEYNLVKHNREKNLRLATLDNCITAVSGILVLLYSQFGSRCIETYGMSGMYWEIEGESDDIFDADVIFGIEPPKLEDWDETELYHFDWNTLKTQANPIEKFNFNAI